MASVLVKVGSIYPDPYARKMTGRSSSRLGDTRGLTQFGANRLILQPGTKSSLRYWHRLKDGTVIFSHAEPRFLVVSTKAIFEVTTYSDVGSRVEIDNKVAHFTRRDSSPLDSKRPR
jgi:uncharacterized cupin superfamily protein